MIVIELSQSTSFIPTLIGAAMWCCANIILAFHRAGLQIVGLILMVGGIAGILISNNVHVCFLLFVAGVAIHFIGRVLANLRNH